MPTKKECLKRLFQTIRDADKAWRSEDEDRGEMKFDEWLDSIISRFRDYEKAPGDFHADTENCQKSVSW
jgi:hypothetical protein